MSPEDRRYHFTALATLHGGWKLYAGIYFESYGYDPSLYGNYYLGHVSGADTTFTHFTGTAQIPNTDYILQINTPQFSRRSSIFRLLQLAGRDENFFEWSAADISITELALNYRPTDKLRAKFSYNASIYWRAGIATVRLPGRHSSHGSISNINSRARYFSASSASTMRTTRTTPAMIPGPPSRSTR